MKYEITIEETIGQNFEVEADSPEEAWEIAREKYNECEFVLDDCGCCGTSIAVYDEDGELLIDYTDL